MIAIDLLPVANHLWQSTLCAGAIWLLALALKKNRAAVRYWLWLASSVKFLIPFSLLVSIGNHVEWRTAPPLGRAQWSTVIDHVSRPFPVTVPVSQVTTLAGSETISFVLAGLWLCGFTVSVIFWLRCWLTDTSNSPNGDPTGARLVNPGDVVPPPRRAGRVRYS